mmetsp:Transcript_82376/g.150781  ORF Transcript_82376/g.150781 Transcript_82376/m.150781 type:complete len:193 (+) Transcript_82376:1485-2063(+)
MDKSINQFMPRLEQKLEWPVSVRALTIGKCRIAKSKQTFEINARVESGCTCFRAAPVASNRNRDTDSMATAANWRRPATNPTPTKPRRMPSPPNKLMHPAAANVVQACPWRIAKYGPPWKAWTCRQPESLEPPWKWAMNAPAAENMIPEYDQPWQESTHATNEAILLQMTVITSELSLISHFRALLGTPSNL